MAEKTEADRLRRRRDLFEQSWQHEQEWRDRSGKAQDFYDGNVAQYNPRADFDLSKGDSDDKDNQNEIAPLIDGVLGENEFIGFDWKVLPVGMEDEGIAKAFYQMMRNIRENGGFESAMEEFFRDGVITGRGLARLDYEPDRDGDKIITFDRIPWTDACIDPEWKGRDINNGCRGLFIFKRVPKDIAVAMWPKLKGMTGDDIELETHEEHSPDSDLIRYWDKENEMFMIVEGWTFENRTEDNPHGQAIQTFFTGQMLLEENIDPLTNKDSAYPKSTFNKIPFVSYVVKRDKKGHPYGLVKAMVPMQNIVNTHVANARYSLATRRLFREENAFRMTEGEIETQMSRPDGHFVVKNGAIAERRFEVVDGIDFAQTHFQLAQSAVAGLQRVSGITKDFLGQESNAISGKALGMREERSRRVLAPVFNNVRVAQILLGKMVINLIGNWFTDDTMIRITNDDGTPEVFRFNAAQGFNDITKFDVIVEKQPYNPNVLHEEFNGLIELKKVGANIPEEALIETSSFPNKTKLLNLIRKQKQEAANQPPPIDVQAKAQKDLAQAEKLKSDAQLGMVKAQFEKLRSEVSNLREMQDASRLGAQTKLTQAKVQTELETAENLRAETEKVFAEIRKIGAEVVTEIRAAGSVKPEKKEKENG